MAKREQAVRNLQRSLHDTWVGNVINSVTLNCLRSSGAKKRRGGTWSRLIGAERASPQR